MKCLILHCKKFSYKLDHKTVVAEETATKEDSIENALVVSIAIEKKDNENSVINASKEILKIANLNNPKEITINPFAHLGGDLAKPTEALKLLKELTAEIGKENKYQVKYTSFGWYKSFVFDVYGHDGSQTFREF